MSITPGETTFILIGLISEAKDFEKGFGLLSLLSNADIKLAKSNSEARRLIQSKAIKLNGKLIDDERYIVSLETFNDSKKLEVSFGKKKSIIIEVC